MGYGLHGIQNIYNSGREHSICLAQCRKEETLELSVLCKRERPVAVLTMHILTTHILFSALNKEVLDLPVTKVRQSAHQPQMKKIMYHPSILPQHLLSLGPFPFKRLLQNLTELTSQLQAEYRALTCAPGHKRDNLLTWGCLPWPQSLDSGTGKGSATVNKASRIVANRSQSRTSPEQLE